MANAKMRHIRILKPNWKTGTEDSCTHSWTQYTPHRMKNICNTHMEWVWFWYVWRRAWKTLLPFSTSHQTFYYYVVHLFMRWNMYYTQSIPYLFKYTFYKYLTAVLGRIYLNIIYVPLNGFAVLHPVCLYVYCIFIYRLRKGSPIIMYIRV